MSTSRSSLRSIGILLVLAGVLAFVCAFSSTAHAPVASAQTIIICSSGQTYSPYGYENCTSPYQTTSVQYCGGYPAPSGYYCCPNGNAIPIGAMCTYTGPQYSQYCNGITVSPGNYCCPSGTVISYATSCVTSPQYSQYCTGIVVPPGDYCCPNGNVVPYSAPCPTAPPPPPAPYCNVYVSPGAPCPSGVATITYPAGWVLVGGPTGTVISGNVGPLYSWRAGDPTYEVIPPGTSLTAGMGYWAYFTVGGSATFPPIPLATTVSTSVPLPPMQFEMIGNPGTTPATVSGADVVLIYQPGGGYQQTNTLPPGRGAWAMSYAGGQAVITPAPY